MDALCISQTSLEEKSQQVSIIGKIFGYATQVLAWMGEHADGSEDLFRPRSEHTSRTVNTSLSEAIHMEIGQRIRSWKHFLERPYLHRRWVVQEIGIAAKILVCCGHDCLD